MDVAVLAFISLSYLVWLTDICEATNFSPLLISSKHWHVFEDDPVGSIVTRLRARDYEGDRVTFNLESQRLGQEIHTYFTLDKHWRVLVAKPLLGLAGGEGSKDYILRVRMNDGNTSPIAEVRLQVLKGTDWEEVVVPEEAPQPIASQGRRLGGRRMADDLTSVNSKVDIPVSNYGILSSIGPGNGFGFIRSLWNSHPPLLQVNRTWTVKADAPLGTLVDTIKVVDITGNDYNLTLHGTQGLLEVDTTSGKVIVASSLENQASDLTIMVTVSDHSGDSSEPVVLRILPVTTTTSPMPPTSRSRNWKPPLPAPIEVQGQLIVFEDEEVNPSAEFNRATESAPRLSAYTLICLILMPILAVICLSSLIIVGFCYCQKSQLKKTLAVMENGRSLAYFPK